MAFVLPTAVSSVVCMCGLIIVCFFLFPPVESASIFTRIDHLAVYLIMLTECLLNGASQCDGSVLNVRAARLSWFIKAGETRTLPLHTAPAHRRTHKPRQTGTNHAPAPAEDYEEPVVPSEVQSQSDSTAG